ncbi:unnamed protein product [Thelazia callipaeda]|uniref:lactoylglutathione lyase n=1 Tax=Thelazia callipaeda TaxID=103827 RepID=A0A0N5CJC6_THECL|nr:unnamed protein product [Thelazia callipaeda]
MKLTSLLWNPVVRNSKGIAIWRESSQSKFPRGFASRRFALHKSPALYASLLTLLALFFRVKSEKNRTYIPKWARSQNQEETATLVDRSELTKFIEKLIKEPPPETSSFQFQQTMFRIKDPLKTLPFYCNILGMRLLSKMDFPAGQFSLYFLGYKSKSEIPDEPVKRQHYALSTLATLELTHNWGTEINPDFSYHNGNKDPRGFGHIGIMVDDVYAACKRFEELGVQFVKKPDEGQMKGLAFIEDPDGYWIEIFNPNIIV